jgi:hypothetical protein
MPKRIASLSLDLDNKWSYMKTHGDAGWEKYPTYLPLVIPRFLEFFKERNDQKMTVFIVGQDASREENHEALASISAAGHEIGNHSFNHEPWLHLYSKSEIETEFAKTEEHLERVTGERTVGFRGPGFSFSPTVLQVLRERGYEYDCSTFPTFLGPLARMYYFMTAKLDDKQKEERKVLFGKLNEGFRPLKPYHWDQEGHSLLEIPVTTMPVFKVPIHVSYLLYLNQFSTLAAKAYWRMSLRMCQLFGVGPSLLLHPLDFMGCDDDSDLGFFPAMRQPAGPKLELISWVMEQFTNRFEVVPMREHAASASATSRKLAIENPIAEPDAASPELTSEGAHELTHA